MVIPSTFPQATSVAHSNTTPNDKTPHSHDNFWDSCFPDPIEIPYHLLQMPQLEVLKILLKTRYGSLFDSDEVTTPVHLNKLSLLVFGDTRLGLLITLLSGLLAPGSVRKHFKLESIHFVDLLDDCSCCKAPARHLLQARILNYQTSAAGCHQPTPWPPQDDLFSLKICCTDHSCLYGRHISYSILPFIAFRSSAILWAGRLSKSCSSSMGQNRTAAVAQRSRTVVVGPCSPAFLPSRRCNSGTARRRSGLPPRTALLLTPSTAVSSPGIWNG
ncbi:hypothetical protein BJV78DRAFT_796474 [Lactifluus subvellereus]|nr:hypothetical protein BJV78DRAFT_796474 [Lactifluus subvellereus]